MNTTTSRDSYPPQVTSSGGGTRKMGGRESPASDPLSTNCLVLKARLRVMRGHMWCKNSVFSCCCIAAEWGKEEPCSIPLQVVSVEGANANASDVMTYLVNNLNSPIMSSNSSSEMTIGCVTWNSLAFVSRALDVSAFVIRSHGGVASVVSSTEK